jgi:hypothetical protein
MMLRRDDVDVYLSFLVGQKKVPKWAERSGRNQRGGKMVKIYQFRREKDRGKSQV